MIVSRIQSFDHLTPLFSGQTLFNNIRNLVTLDLSSNLLEWIDQGTLPQTEIIHLSNNSLKQIPELFTSDGDPQFTLEKHIQCGMYHETNN